MSPKMRPVSKEEFEAFLAAYPRPLERDVFGACEPPAVSYNDFERAPMWPDSIVASCNLGGGNYQVIVESA